jgi:prepilin-type N-terminal cleavage/methylation domain-containing protein
MKKILNNQSGFSLVEVLVAITILLMVITGPMTIMTKANHSTAFASEQSTAWFLAQEGLELAQKLRDDQMLQYFSGGNPNPWSDVTTAIATACFSSFGCGLTISSAGTAVTVTNCNPLTNCRLYLDSAPSRSAYVHTTTGTTNPTPFTRVVTLNEIKSGEIEVTSTVTWRTGSLIASQQVVAVTYLFNIYDTL